MYMSVKRICTYSFQDEEIPLLDVRPQLRFHADNRNLSGRYTCVAANGVGEPAMGHINLRIRCESHLFLFLTMIPCDNFHK